MGIAEEIEQWLSGHFVVGPEYDVIKDPGTSYKFPVARPLTLNGFDLPEINEWPKNRFRYGIGWFRKCHRCEFGQRSKLPVEFAAIVHVCMRDSTLKSIKWNRWPR